MILRLLWKSVWSTAYIYVLSLFKPTGIYCRISTSQSYRLKYVIYLYFSTERKKKLISDGDVQCTRNVHWFSVVYWTKYFWYGKSYFNSRNCFVSFSGFRTFYHSFSSAPHIHYSSFVINVLILILKRILCFIKSHSKNLKFKMHIFLYFLVVSKNILSLYGTKYFNLEQCPIKKLFYRKEFVNLMKSAWWKLLALLRTFQTTNGIH
jgi:hypothetical protein